MGDRTRMIDVSVVVKIKKNINNMGKSNKQFSVAGNAEKNRPAWRVQGGSRQNSPPYNPQKNLAFVPITYNFVYYTLL
jgi:hypothetical protein